MVDNTSIATKSALRAAFSPASSLPLLVSSGSPHSTFVTSQPHQAGGGMKLEAVMENLQRQQAARLALEEKIRKEKEKEFRSMVESQIQQQALAIRQYQAAVRVSSGTGASLPVDSRLEPHRPPLLVPVVHNPELEEVDPANKTRADHPADRDRAMGEDGEDDFDEDMEEDLHEYQPQRPDSGSGHSPKGTLMVMPKVGQAPYALAGQSHSPSSLAQAQTHHHEWTYEEQFKQLYELDDDPKRKEFLDDLFSFMQKRGTPVNRIPIMAKQVLDLYSLYRLVTEKGGLVEVINKKIWREITKGLNLPTSITSAAFTLRTQYMKYLYPYECEKRALSSPGELQVAIDSNRREGRRQSYGTTLFNYSPVGTPAILQSPKIQMPTLSLSTANGAHIVTSTHAKRKDGILTAALPSRIAIPVSLASHQVAAAQAAAMAQAAALEQLREKLDSGEPAEKKMTVMVEEQQRLVQHALQQNLLAMATQYPMSIKINSRDDRQEAALNLSTNGISSINMSIEINGIVYTGVLFARRPVIPVAMGNNHSSSSSHPQSRCSPASAQNQPSSSSSSSSSCSSHNHTPTSSSP
ncbi:AT-rich interactive domain-containing protein 3A isoform X2 [Latimeria chalumnae]|uniref:AT-rich interactive domain-containing protein 3A isoform X2 n=1 Tax=Latimeria chalumnae TaxID=7897 RepID=UPI00313C1963